jgi:hypothetical protein
MELHQLKKRQEKIQEKIAEVHDLLQRLATVELRKKKSYAYTYSPDDLENYRHVVADEWWEDVDTGIQRPEGRSISKKVVWGPMGKEYEDIPIPHYGNVEDAPKPPRRNLAKSSVTAQDIEQLLRKQHTTAHVGGSLMMEDHTMDLITINGQKFLKVDDQILSANDVAAAIAYFLESGDELILDS